VIESVRTRLESLIATLDEEIATVELEIASALQQDESWAAAIKATAKSGQLVVTGLT
jgi:hypothetical protein